MHPPVQPQSPIFGSRPSATLRLLSDRLRDVRLTHSWCDSIAGFIEHFHLMAAGARRATPEPRSRTLWFWADAYFDTYTAT